MLKVSATHTLLLIDLLGFGASPKPNSNYSLETQLQAIEKVIIKAGFGERKSSVVGHSMGTTIALALLGKHQDWFNGGVFISLPTYRNVKEFNKRMSTHSLVDRLTTSNASPYLCMLHPVFMNRAFKPANMSDQFFDDAKKARLAKLRTLFERNRSEDRSIRDRTIRDRHKSSVHSRR
jgi:pimeloyl-ACP methyl ester carboxylesterase